MTIQAAMKEAEKNLSGPARNRTVDAALLTAHVLGCEKMALYTRLHEEMESDALIKLRKLIARRVGGEPLQYITGVQWFMERVFEVNQNVLIPRYDTETLVQWAIELLLDSERKKKVLDIGTGSGAIAISLTLATDCDVTATDISELALQTAQKNAKRHSAAVSFMQSDLFRAIRGTGLCFDMIISNPPYISSGDILSLDREVRDFEPGLALDGGSDGLQFYREIIKQAKEFLYPGGWLMFEVGFGQAEAVGQMLSYDIGEPVSRFDINGIERAVGARWNGG